MSDRVQTSHYSLNAPHCARPNTTGPEIVYFQRQVEIHRQPSGAKQSLGLGDAITGTLESGALTHYRLNIEDTTESFDIVLFSSVDTAMNISDDEGHRIRSVNHSPGYGYEVFTWEPGDSIPVQIEVCYGSNRIA